jgi:hypothetical protein
MMRSDVMVSSLRQTLVRWRRNVGVRVHHGGQHVINLLGDRIRKLRVRDQVGGKPARHLFPQCRYTVI